MTQPIQRPWIIYLRVSTDEQAREGVSLDAQRQACEAMAFALSLPVAVVISDPGKSAKDLDRPGVQRALAAIDDKSVAGIIVYKLDRLTRSRRDLEDLLDRVNVVNAGLISVSEKLDTSSPMGRFFVAMLGAIAQWERETIAERVTMGMRHRKAQGGFVGGQVPAGLVAIGEPGHRELQAHDKWGPVVSELWPMLLRGQSLRIVADHLTAAGLPTGRNGEGWTPTGVRKMALSPRYVGHLCTSDDVEQVRAVLSSRFAPGRAGGRMARTQTHTTRPWILSGVGRCGLCESPLVGVTGTNATGVSYPYYRCTGRVAHGVKKCRATDLRAEPWERAVVELLIKSVSNDGLLLPALTEYAKLRRKQAVPLREEFDQLTMERDRVSAELRNLTEMAAQGGLIAQGLGAGIAERQRRWNEMDARRSRIEGELAAASMTTDEVEAQMAILTAGVDGLADEPLEKQADTIRMMVESVKIRRNQDDKTKGEADLAIRLPRKSSTLFVSAWPLVEQVPQRTNSVMVSDSVSLVFSR